jgi:NADPH2:quinone reductase
VANPLGWGPHTLAPLSFGATSYSGVSSLLPVLTDEGRVQHAEILSQAKRMAEAGQLPPSHERHRFTLDKLGEAYCLIADG